MDALTLLKHDHDKVKGLFKEALDLEDRASSSLARLARQIEQELTLHAQVEEQIFYPALKERATQKHDPDAKEEVLEALEEHAGVKDLIQKLQVLEPSDETFRAKLSVMHEMVEHHVKEEEHTMFREARRLLDKGEREQLGERIAQMKQQAGAPA